MIPMAEKSVCSDVADAILAGEFHELIGIESMKVIGYIRVSTDEQVRDGVSMAMQREKIQVYCNLHNLELVEIVEDAGASAKNMDRPGLQRAIERLKATDVGGFVIYKLDRLSRNLTDWCSLINAFFREAKGKRSKAGPAKQLFSVTDSIDTRTPTGRMIVNVLMTFAEFEREQITGRVQAAMDHKRQKGELIGKVPYGFDLAGDGVKLVPNAAEQAVVTRIRSERAAKRSYEKIARDLTAESVATKQGGAAWSWQSVRRIAERPGSGDSKGTNDERQGV